MIPTYNPSEFLLETLDSVVQQIEDPADFQIAIVDDSPQDNATKKLLEKFAEYSIDYCKNEKNLGLAGNWNRCIELSRGRWIHILHQDDLIYPGFYAAMCRAALAGEEIGMAFCRNEFKESGGSYLAELEMESEGILENWLERLAVEQRIQFPSVVVRKDVYERVGGFSEEFSYALDWEMWARIAKDYSVWYVPQALSCYRVHADNETARLARIGVTVDDEYAAARKISSYLSSRMRRQVWPIARRKVARRVIVNATRLIDDGMRKDGMKMFRKALSLDPSLLLTSMPFDYLKWDVKLIFKSIIGR
jgi:glycosyltransferase involved in cell wall biosynthesis